MTIAACYVSPEGVVLGADSTASSVSDGTDGSPARYRFYNHNQKLFEIGEGSTAGVVIWGMGGLGKLSYRTLFARLDQDSTRLKLQSLHAVALHFASTFWTEYQNYARSQLQIFASLGDSDEDKKTRQTLIRKLSGGFCIGGRWGTQFEPEAWVIEYAPNLTSAPVPKRIGPGDPPGFWGWRNILERVFLGFEPRIFRSVLTSGKWSGTPQELAQLFVQGFLGPPGGLPIREAIDWVHSSIYTTIKTIKFANLPSVCGGFIDIAVVTTDRRFRWVKHKRMDDAIRHSSSDGGEDGESEV